MLWFKYKNKTIEKKAIKETKAIKKADRIAKKEAILLQKEAFNTEQIAIIPVQLGIQKTSIQNRTIQLYKQPKKFNFVPITLFVQDCLNSYCLQKLLTILQHLPKHSEVILDSCYLIDRLQYNFPDIIFHELPACNKIPTVSGHFVAAIQLTTMNVHFLIESIQKIFLYPYEVYLFYHNSKSNVLLNRPKNDLNQAINTSSNNKLNRASKYGYNAIDMQMETQQRLNILHRLTDISHLCTDKLFLIYTNTIAKKILQIKNHIPLNWKSNFLPLLLSNNFCYLDNLPEKNYTFTNFKQLEADIKEYLKTYTLFKTNIHNDEHYILFYKVIEDKLLLYYAHLILKNRLDKLEKFDSTLQKNYFVFYIGLAQHSPLFFIEKLRKKYYKVNLLTKYLAKKIISTAKKASK